MPSLVYAPSCTIRIHSTKLNTTIDVSEDIESWNVNRLLGPSLSTASWSLLNQGQKYSGVFSPMDRVVIYLRRIRTVLGFSGYLDDVPMWSALPHSARFSASCTLKRLAEFYWDPGSPAAVSLFGSDSNESINKGLNDGGLTQRTISLLTEVAGWNKDQVHIGAIPRDWFDKVAPLMQEAVSDADAARLALQVGSDSYLGGQTPLANSYSQIQGIGPGTGALPDVFGKISSFGGPNGGAYGQMALTGEPGVKPNDDWYCAMRWPYVTDNLAPIKGVDVAAAKAWWANRRILVTSPKTHKAVILRAVDWGPNISTGRVIDVSPAALTALGISTDDIVNIAFAEQSGKTAQVGPVDTSVTPSPIDPASSPSTGSSPGAVTSGWGNHGDAANMRTVSAGGCSFTVHHLAVDKFVGFVTDLVNVLGYHPKTIYGFDDRVIAGSSTWSNHAYGAAIDIDASLNPRYPSAAGGPYALPHPPEIIQYARKWGLGWGGEYRNSKDFMHFEVIGAPASPKYAPVSGTPTGAGSVQSWVVPIEAPYKITAHFGDGGSLWAHGHSGTDFACTEGTPIRPVGPGVVHTKGFAADNYGNYVTVDHGNGVYTLYGHMGAPSPLSVGDSVDINSQLGQVGMTGNATGFHVHVELRLDVDDYDHAADIEKYLVGKKVPPPRGVTGSTLAGDVIPVTGSVGDGGSGGSMDLSSIGGGLLNVYQWASIFTDVISESLVGNRALMNDEPILQTVDQYMGAGFRDFCSAPNGDFIGWFPDYFGHYGTAGKMVIAPIEIDIESAPPSIRWSDEGLKTHQYAIGSISGILDTSGELEMALTTAGIATIEDPRLLETLLNVTAAEAEALSETMSKRLGARPKVNRLSTIKGFGTEQEFFFACREFMRNWSAQWHTTMNVTFMPELFPGMLACFPIYGLQGYVVGVNHSGDYTGGFTTQVSCAPWSTIGKKGPSGLPRGASL